MKSVKSLGLTVSFQKRINRETAGEEISTVTTQWPGLAFQWAVMSDSDSRDNRRVVMPLPVLPRRVMPLVTSASLNKSSAD